MAMQRQNRAEEKTIHTAPASFERCRPRCLTRTALMKSNLQLHAEVAALLEDNKQLRAALSIFSEVARNSPAYLPVNLGRTA
jgi:hypothetical protein